MNRPFVLRPSGKDYLWGGSRLNTDFEKRIDLYPLAETWECSTHEDGPSYVDSGIHKGQKLAELLKEHPEYLGSKHSNETELQLLVKLIDADQDLSVQVHPSDEYAEKNEGGQRGKFEMWYVLDAVPGASIVYGLSEEGSREELKAAAEAGTLTRLLRRVPVKKGDIFTIEPGTIHAIGAGVLVAEIQESSNLTYRLYDYDRIDKNGKKRELHLNKALEVVNLNSSQEPRQPIRVLKYRPGSASELLCSCRYFEVYRLIVNSDRKQIVSYQTDSLSFRVLLCVSGCGIIRGNSEDLLFYSGDCVFVPADSEELIIHGRAEFLDIRG